MVQSRIVYVTGNDEIDRILNDISQRLDTIEGLRPDLDAGYYTLDSEKDISTGDPLDIDDVSISRGSIIITSTTGSTITITGDSFITLNTNSNTITIEDESISIVNNAGNSIIVNSEDIIVYDVNDEIVHRIGTWS